RPRYAPAPAGAGWFRRLMNPLVNGQAWLDLLWGIVSFPFSLAAFVLATVWWAIAIAGLTSPIHGWIVARIPGVELWVPTWLGFPEWLVGSDLFFVIFNTGVGLLFALTLVPVLRIAALLKAGVAQAMLTRAPEPSVTAHGESAWMADR
ncbi:sensor domain-containing protein, partial [Nonomuraea basaltis]|uniref:sensor domain-containing protein n=1 Tax=Nonomuraea basaltis TaxID=2495887 RepID=UPI0014864576